MKKNHILILILCLTLGALTYFSLNYILERKISKIIQSKFKSSFEISCVFLANKCTVTNFDGIVENNYVTIKEINFSGLSVIKKYLVNKEDYIEGEFSINFHSLNIPDLDIFIPQIKFHTKGKETQSVLKSVTDTSIVVDNFKFGTIVEFDFINGVYMLNNTNLIFNLNLPELIDKYYNANDTGIPKEIFIELLKQSFQKYNLIFNYDFLKFFEPGIKTLNVNISNPNKLNQEDIIKLFNTPEFFNQMKVVVF